MDRSSSSGLRDRSGRDWQCGTVQLDFVLPERLGAEYVDEANRRVRPAMLHHAVFGSLERFIAILLEHHQGALPFWLAPEQIVVAPVGAAQAEAAQAAAEAFERAGLRVTRDDRAETLSRRRAEARERGAAVFAVIGAREAREGSVALSRREGEPLASPIGEAVAALAAEARP
jgi:threonyl-tRNA synthetase